MNLDTALDVVARWTLSGLTDDRIEWSDFPEFSEDDHRALTDRIADIANSPSNADYEAAYAFLADRAGDA